MLGVSAISNPGVTAKQNRVKRIWAISLLAVPLIIGIVLERLASASAVDGFFFLPTGLFFGFMLFVPFTIICTIVAIVLLVKSSMFRIPFKVRR